MFWKKEDKPFIRFRHREDHELWPKPKRSGKFMPDWIKGLSRVPEGKHKVEGGTVKRCVPVIDAISNGYIIPSWCDWFVKVGQLEHEDGELEPTIQVTSPSNLGLEQTIDQHSWEQVGEDCPLKHYPVGRVIMKFVNPWVIETSPGWSVLIKSPPNHFNNVNLIEGVVDTDTYNRQINIPWFWDGAKQGEYFINKGDPLIHVIPFKRQEVELQHDAWDHDRMNKMDRLHETGFYDNYRNFWWHKRRQ